MMTSNVFTKNKFAWNFAIVIIAILALYQYRYGLEMLDPTNDNWLLRHDWATHYLGWFFYRNEDWSFPFGEVHKYFYPVGTNVAFTDSIPLVAIPLKLLNPILPEKFQYIGLFLFSCHVLLGYFLLKLFSRFSVDGFLQLLAVLIIVINPVLLYRSIHPALCTHWLIVANIWVYFMDVSGKGLRKVLLYQFILLILSGMINPYMCAMVAPLLLALVVRLFLVDKVLRLPYTLLYLLGSFSFLLAMFYFVGFFTFNSQSDLGIAGAYGLYSVNLNSLYNSWGFSSILPNFKIISWHQYEGFLYLGVGGMLLLVVFFFIFVDKEKKSKQLRSSYGGINIIPLLIAVLLLSIFALTNVISIDDQILLKIPIPDLFKKIGEIFRASARFIWVAYYLFTIAAIIYIIRSVSPRISISLLVLILGLQLYDYRLLLSDQGLTYKSHNSPLTEKYWSMAFKNASNITFYPPLETTYLTDQDYRYFSYLAATNKKPIDMGYLARQDNKATSDFVDHLNEQLDAGIYGDTSIYVSTIPHSNRFSAFYQLGLMECINLDQYLIFLPTNIFSKDVLDTLKAHSLPLPASLRQKFNFSEYALPKTAEQGDLMSNIDKIRTVEKYITVTGWASIKDKGNPEPDSTWIILKSTHNQFYSVKTSLSVRKDVSGYFKNPNMDSTGFYTQAFTEHLKKGNYDLGIYVKNNQTGQGIYKFIKKINIGYPDQFEVTPFTDELVPADLNLNVDKFDDSPDLLKIGGWAAFPKENATGSEISVLFKSGDNKIFISPTNNTLREDVTAYFKNEFNLDESGFDASISKKGFPKGKYQIGIRLRRPDKNQEGIYFTDKYIEKQ